MKKKILVMHTGGTISMCMDERTGVVKPKENNPLMEQTNVLNNFAEVVIEEPFHLPSPHITPKDMLVLKLFIEEKIKRERVDGIVITHGTDTLEETAYFLHITLNINIPVVITGAMRSSNEMGADGMHNLLSAIQVAASDEASNKGVLIVFNDEIHSAQFVTKTHTSNVDAFKSTPFGPVGTIAKNEVFFFQAPLKREHINIHNLTKEVILLKAYAGMDSKLLNYLADIHIDGVVIEAFGLGNLPPQTVDGVIRLLQKNIPVVVVSRCISGIVCDTYGYKGGGKDLKEKGVIFAKGLNGQKARIKLLTLLETTNDLYEIRDKFEK